MKRFPWQALLLMLCISGSGLSCASIEPAPEAQVTPAQLQQRAKSFVEALFLIRSDELRQTVAFPFYYNQRALLASAEEWEQIVTALARQKPAVPFQVISVKAFSKPEILSQRPRLWASFLEYELEDLSFWLCKVRLPLSEAEQKRDAKGRRFREGVILIMLDPTNGKTRGFIL